MNTFTEADFFKLEKSEMLAIFVKLFGYLNASVTSRW